MFVVFSTSKGTFVSMPVDEIGRIEWDPPSCYLYTRKGEPFAVKGELRRVDSFIESINAAVNMIRRVEVEKMQESVSANEKQTTVVVKRNREKPQP